jgi:amyloid beta precursor protein binding protein 1
MVKDIDTLDDHEHGHIPYVVILLHFLEQWRQSHDGKNPTTLKEKKEFGKLVMSGSRTNNPEGGEENFQEAATAINKNIKVPELDAGLEEVFNYLDLSEVRFLLDDAYTESELELKMIGRTTNLILDYCQGD